MAERMITTDGVDICTDSAGDPSHPPVLLIHGAQTSMIHWYDEFVSELVARGRFVVRYDNRDTGRSVTYEPGKPGYSLADFVSDALAVLDAYGLDTAHIVGMSLGGMVAQLLGIQHPDRVRTITLISSTPGDSEDLPPMAERLVAHFTTATCDWSDAASIIDYTVEGARLLAGSGYPFETEYLRRYVSLDLERAVNMPSRLNHALMETGAPWRKDLGKVTAPTLVIHGSEDPLLPLPHGEALAKEIPNARLIALEGVGHELPPQEFEAIADAILDHTA